MYVRKCVTIPNRRHAKVTLNSTHNILIVPLEDINITEPAIMGQVST